MMDLEERQLSLALLHYYTLRYSRPPRAGDLAIDRLPGAHMTGAIRLFQADNHLEQDGLWGPETETAVRLAVYENRCRKAAGLQSNTDIAGTVHDFLRAKGLPPAAVGGIMGNLSVESAMNPTNLEDHYERPSGFTDLTYTQAVDEGSYREFARDRFGYGLCQWTWDSRKLGLLTAARMQGVSVGSPELQLSYLWRELRTYWPGLLQKLMDPDICLEDAARGFMEEFENPADQSAEAVKRRVRTARHYYDRYCC